MNGKFRVLIAEDEAEIGRALAEIVASHPDFEVAGRVSDGAEALAFLKTHPLPDLLITDIRMPRVDGLELLRYAHERRLGLRAVIVSGYNHFEYAQKAIKYGACDYILKPILPADCLSALDALAARMKRGADRPYDLNLALNRRAEPLPAFPGPLFLLAAALGNFPFGAAGEKFDEAALRNLCAGLQQIDPAVSAFGVKNGVYYLLFHAASAKDARALLDAVGAAAASRYPAHTLALSAPLASEDVCCVSGKLCAQMRRGALFCGRCAIDLNAPRRTGAQTNAIGKLFEMDEQLVSSIRFRDYSVFRGLLREKFAQWERDCLPAAALLDYVKFQYVYAGQQIFAASSLDSAPISYDWENKLSAAFTSCESWEGLFEAVFQLFSELFNVYQAPDAPRRITLEIEAYIEKHYAEHITNQTLAKHFGFVPSYISKLFKDYKGVSPCEYLTQVRIEHAQRIIREGDSLNLYEISFTLGFSDSSYFTKIFKKYVGMTPSEYKALTSEERNP